MTRWFTGPLGWLTGSLGWLTGSLRRVALFLLGLSVLFAVLWAVNVAGWVSTLAPNVITTGLGIALTVTVIDGILERRERERVRPIVNYTLENIRLGLMIVLQTLAIDYAQSHRTPKKIPDLAHDLIDFWLENDALADDPRRIGDQKRLPYPVGSIFEFAESTYRQTEENRHDLIRADLTEIVMASKRMATSLSLLATLIVTSSDARKALDDNLVEADREAQREEAERDHRRKAVETFRKFVNEYEAALGDRGPLRSPGNLDRTVETYRQVFDGQTSGS